MASIGISGSGTGTQLNAMLMGDDIVPGAAPSYELCKLLYSYHPLGKKMVDKPITMAQSQERKLTFRDTDIPDDVRDQFVKQWIADGMTKHIFNLMRLSRMYGISSLALSTKGQVNSEPVDYKNLWKETVSYASLDPLNTAGSLVLNQDPNSLDFQKVTHIAVNGVNYHRSRAVVIMNEEPLYIEYTSSAFGFVGRSVFQRVLYLMQSFIRTMITDNMVARKAGLLIAKMKAVGSVVDNMIKKMFGVKRSLLKDAETDNVLSIDTDESVESIDLVNVEAATASARKNIIENIALGADMPAKLLTQESFAEGFGEGAEDSKAIADYIDDVRNQMAPAYAWADQIVQFRAWNPDFFETMKAKYPDLYGSVEYEAALYTWINNFQATWPSFLREPESDQAEVEDVKFGAVIGLATLLLPQADPANKATILGWIADTTENCPLLFPTPLVLDVDAMATYKPEPVAGEEGSEKTPPKSNPSAKLDSAIAAYRQSFLKAYPPRREREVARVGRR